MNFKYKRKLKASKKDSDLILFVYQKLNEYFENLKSESKKLSGLLIYSDTFCFQGWEVKDGEYKDTSNELFTVEYDDTWLADEELLYSSGQGIICSAVVQLHFDGKLADIIGEYPFEIYIDVEDGSLDLAMTINNAQGANPTKEEKLAFFKDESKLATFEALFITPEPVSSDVAVTLSATYFDKATDSTYHDASDYDWCFRLRNEIALWEKPMRLEIFSFDNELEPCIKELNKYIEWMKSKPEYLSNFFKRELKRDKQFDDGSKKWFMGVKIANAVLCFNDEDFDGKKLKKPSVFMQLFMQDGLGNKMEIRFDNKSLDGWSDEW